jgi:peptide/nickel transport system substrate-binding protein
MNFLPDGTLLPNLVERVPSVENGLLAADSRSVTHELKPGVVWSDGTPFTSADVQFTWQWVTNQENGATTYETFSTISEVEIVDDTSVTFHFDEPQPAWYVPFSGSWWGAVYPKHILEGSTSEEYAQFLMKPVGTGPFVVEEFAPGDQVTYRANETFRDPNKPFFSTVILKGGGDAAAAARSVLQTGEFNLAWNLQVEPELLADMESEGIGSVVIYPGASLEQVYLNFSDPNTEVGGEFSSLSKPHPFLTDIQVRQAFALATNRAKVASELYGEGEPATANVLVGIPRLESPNNEFAFDLDKAAQLLDDAGWMVDGDVRKKKGVEMSVTYNTTVNAIRQKTQAIIKQDLESVGVRVELKQTDPGIYFDSSPGNTQSYIHFYDDLGMSTANIDSPFPLAYMNRWYAGEDHANIPQKANDWGGRNLQRFVDEEYDTLFRQVMGEIDPETSAQIFIAMNDLLVRKQVLIPLVQRAAETLGVNSRLRVENIEAGPFETAYWNIANWNTAE